MTDVKARFGAHSSHDRPNNCRIEGQARSVDRAEATRSAGLSTESTGGAAIIAAVFDRVVIRAADLPESLRFYRAVLPPLGFSETAAPAGFGDGAVAFGELVIAAADAEHPATEHLHVGLVAPSHDEIRSFWQAGVDAGFESDGDPGGRAEYSPRYFGGFLLDPGGNSIEGARHENLRGEGTIDHLWIRVGLVDATKRFYDAVRIKGDFALVAQGDGYARYRGPEGGSFTIVDDGRPRTVGLDMSIGDLRFTDTDGRALKLRRS